MNPTYRDILTPTQAAQYLNVSLSWPKIAAPNKNICLLGDIPPFHYSIYVAMQIKRVNQIIVSTDSMAYAELAQRTHPEVPKVIMRPKKYAKDDSTDFDVINHALGLIGTEKYQEKVQ